ncbi:MULTISPECIES: hypothetical protein [unclassified Micromonospora]|uniref:hypothetical protein n=1 Tax=unclassified Micromonospora TaxID=2617518 RepID=UPI001C5DAC13|nr:hypothetical protein [Micromonospora sp. RL09-050-HVF-A]MBW4705615.1 hypothetical protein [Micromonospora sp. RL09-050-HVF-A]
MAATTRRTQRIGGTPHRHSVILEYLKILPAVLTGVAAVLVALTGLLTLLVR